MNSFSSIAFDGQEAARLVSVMHYGLDLEIDHMIGKLLFILIRITCIERGRVPLADIYGVLSPLRELIRHVI